MQADQFRYKKSTQELLIGDRVVPIDSENQWFAPLKVVEAGTISSLRRALKDWWSEFNYPREGKSAMGLSYAYADITLSPADPDEFDEDYSIALETSLHFDQDFLVVADTVIGLHGTDIDEPDLIQIATPVATSARAEILDAGIEGSGTQSFGRIRYTLKRRGATVSDLVAIGKAISLLFSQIHDGEIDVKGAQSLIMAGRADLLVGMSESNWLEVKTQGYDLASDAGRIELSQDVGRFANGTHDALLVLGMRSKQKAGEDVIIRVTPLRDVPDTSRYHRAIDSRLFPPVEGLEIRRAPITTAPGYLLTIYIPAQAEELKPFLVHGAILGDRTEGAFISIVQRRGEHSVPVRPETIHSTLAAGRALLRRGQIPETTP